MRGRARRGRSPAPDKSSAGAAPPPSHHSISSARGRQILGAGFPSCATLSFLLLLSIASGCRRSPARSSVEVIGLVSQFAAAEKRPAESAFEVADYSAGGVPRPSIVSPAPSRLTWTLRLPARGSFHAQLHVRSDSVAEETLVFRVGVADHRVYETLAHVSLSSGNGGWTPISVDLSRYAGWKWSLFYRPDAHEWRLILGVDAPAESRAHAVWGAPGISTDTAGARAFAQSGSAP